MNIPPLIKELDEFLALTTLSAPPPVPGVVDLSGRLVTAGNEADIVAAAQVVEKILDRAIPGWRASVPTEGNKRNKWWQHREAAQRARAELERQEDVRAMLGSNAPDLNASQLHPWIWDSAKSLWESKHYRQAVTAAAVKLNAETQNKIGRKDVSEKDLFRQAFTTKAPELGKARLRLMLDDGSPTYTSLQEGVAAFAEGCYRAIRNPASHTVLDELPEHEALEQLAAFSMLARWVDAATVEPAP